jgi:hypothetical protein
VIGPSLLGLLLSSSFSFSAVTFCSYWIQREEGSIFLSGFSDGKGSVKWVSSPFLFLVIFDDSDATVVVSFSSTVGFSRCCCYCFCWSCPIPTSITFTFTLYGFVILEGLFSQDILWITSFTPSVRRGYSQRVCIDPT